MRKKEQRLVEAAKAYKAAYDKHRRAYDDWRKDYRERCMSSPLLQVAEDAAEAEAEAALEELRDAALSL